MECPTVRIKATSGSYPFTTINESDFDPEKHELYVEGDAPAGAASGDIAAEPASIVAYKRGRK